MWAYSERSTAPRSVDGRPSRIHPSPPTRPDPFDSLATETMQMIFSLCCPSINLPRQSRARMATGHSRPLNTKDMDPDILSVVCRRWRAIMISHHELWTNIIIDSSKIDEEAWFNWGFSQLREHLQRSGVHPLKIHIKGYMLAAYREYYDNNTVASRILNLVTSHSQRWKTIGLDFTHREQSHLIDALSLCTEGQFPLLESLHIRSPQAGMWPLNRGPCMAFCYAPSLTRICIGTAMPLFRMVAIPWTQISEVTFDKNTYFTETELHEILVGLSSSSVTALTFSNITIRLPWHLPAHWNYGTSLASSRPVTLAKLQKLRFLGKCKDVLNMLICPSLERLELEDAAELEDEITRFLDRSSCPLVHICLYYDNNLSGDAMECYRILNKLSQSTLKSISLAKIDDPLQVLDLLLPNSFPSLETLNLDLDVNWNTFNGNKYLLYIVKGLRKIVVSRTQPTINHTNESSSGVLFGDIGGGPVKASLKECFFTFNLSGLDDSIGWDETPLQKLRSLCISRHVLRHFDVVHNHHSYPDGPIYDGECTESDRGSVHDSDGIAYHW